MTISRLQALREAERQLEEAGFRNPDQWKVWLSKLRTGDFCWYLELKGQYCLKRHEDGQWECITPHTGRANGYGDTPERAIRALRKRLLEERDRLESIVKTLRVRV